VKVKDLMTQDVVSVAPATTLKEVARLLVQHRISGVPVCDREHNVLGVVSESDILGEGGPTAADAMTSPAIVTTPLRTVAEVARLMVSRDVNRLPVVRGDKLVGILTRADLVRAFSRPDEDIAREIREQVIDETLWLASDEVQVDVNDGEVVLRGKLHARSDANLLALFVARVPGVVSVKTELSWETDDRLAPPRLRAADPSR
jgi:predicted transcriptional regulator